MKNEKNKNKSNTSKPIWALWATVQGGHINPHYLPSAVYNCNYITISYLYIRAHMPTPTPYNYTSNI